MTGAIAGLDEVSALLENNLVRQVEQPDGEPRLLLLHTIREFGLEWNAPLPQGGLALDNDVRLEVSLELVREV